ncbi:MAG: bifunctional phosphoribosyl-AMP cyclohydrolase/phosphoribosyl-ATP diphosphatase HisIE [Gemmatimonas sp.]|nr:bifunctional phosphoribosyl-AMP cyclohydrolase/phosphoribosyl-ATP diphosphatase HisIE [Gemmatimonas sp.]
MSWLEEISFDTNGLVPVVVQEATTGEVLMLAYANREAIEVTWRTGQAHYWSRSRQELWRKGATSGNVQDMLDLRLDCDGDAVLYVVRQAGAACHTLEHSCFHRQVENDELTIGPSAGHILSRIEQIVESRATELPEGSYTSYLFRSGLDKILKKVGEESTEVVIAAKNEDPSELRAETADLLYHLLVLLQARKLPVEEVWNELEDRFGREPRLPKPRHERSTAS